jgi:hypothetical protein
MDVSLPMRAEPAIEEMARQFQARSAPKPKLAKLKMPTSRTRKGRRQRDRMAAAGLSRFRIGA